MLSGIPLSSINIDTSKDNKSEELLIDLNNNESENNLLLNKNNDKNKSKLQKKREYSFTFKSGPLKKIEEGRIICFSRRRKSPKNCNDLVGVITSLVFFIFFTILITIGLAFAKKRDDLSDSLKSLYNWIILFTWITSIISILCLLDAASADPGQQRGTPVNKFQFTQAKIKKIVGGQKYILKYCTTCHLIRDIRTFHCSTCGMCIEKHDHHCNYLSNCVGVYNYKKFFIFLVASCIHVNIIFFTDIHYILFCQGEMDSGYEWIVLLMTTILLFAGFFEIFTVWMVIQHIITIVQNRTTREFIKKKEYESYNKGCKENCKEALCSNEIKEF